MKKLGLLICIGILSAGSLKSAEIPKFYNEVDQVLWVVSDVENTMLNYRLLGFDQFMDLGTVEVKSLIQGSTRGEGVATATQLVAVENWFEELKRLAPPSRN